MLLVSHIIVALLSLATSAVLFFLPSKTKLHLSYAFTSATIVSGTWLVVASGTHILRSCLMGLLIVGICVVAATSAKKRLAIETN